ncbi:LuxR C-terminal-related transcriptional regulator [Paenibacillus sinopodophylli]|uniref:LuxR C-terminal-related transcriptional regulator n=1 Tax=Paenibacillus sinopodophylli TaxID=1837342 RepID=UPI00110CC0E2|nr:LuxR C-terminal-related transcriptional regulator [Paenibacillus sinopodophylli]
MFMQTKVSIPYLYKSLVHRPNLINKLDEGLNTKLTVLSAQAGYGKTTALSEWAKRCGTPVAWVSLDKLDNDWSPFWSCVIAAVREIAPDFGLPVMLLLEQEAEVSFETVITAFINELITITAPLVIVLDDFHVIDHGIINKSLSYLLEYLPHHIHLYMASRVELLIPTTRLLAKGEINFIQTQDLRFDLEEGIVFLRELMDLMLTQEQMHMLFRQTEGWVSGLQLAAISLKRSVNVADSIRHFNGQQRQISDYLLEEVFNRQSDSMREFLLATSILNRMNASLCEAVTGQADSQDQLERLEKMNLFIVPLDDSRKWYRYHHLLSDFLKRIGSAEDEEKWMQYHRRAAKWWESQENYEEAVDHYIEGQQASEAVRNIDRSMLEYSQIMRWITALPQSSYEEKPMFELYYISKLVTDGQWDHALQRASQVELRFAALSDVLDESEWMELMGNLYFYCGIISYLQLNLPQASYYYEKMEQHLPNGSSFQSMGSKRYQGYDQFTDLLSLNNDLQVVEQFQLKWIKAWEHKKNYPFVGYQYVTYCMLLLEQNRLEEAELYLRQALGRSDLRSNTWVWVQLSIMFAWLQQIMGNETLAKDVLKQLKSNVDSPDYDLFVRHIEAEEANLSLHQGAHKQALEWLERSGLFRSEEISLHRISEYLIVARILAGSERTAAAMELLDKMQQLMDKNTRLRDRIKLLIVQCVVYGMSDQLEASLEKLQYAMEIAEPVGYIRSFIDEGPMMVEMIKQFAKRQQHVLEADVTVSKDYVIRLLQASGDWSLDEQQPIERLTDQEMKVLLLVADGLQNKEIALRLHITIETVKYHIKNIYRKLDANNRIRVLQRAKELRIIT